jgi:hypothetical protein
VEVSESVEKTALIPGSALSSAASSSGDAEGLAEVAPAFAELAAVDGQDAIAGRAEVDDRGLHGAGARRGQDIDVLFGAEDVFQAFRDLHEDFRKFGRAVVDDGLRRRGQDPVRDGRRAGRW